MVLTVPMEQTIPMQDVSKMAITIMPMLTQDKVLAISPILHGQTKTMSLVIAVGMFSNAITKAINGNSVSKIHGNRFNPAITNNRFKT